MTQRERIYRALSERDNDDLLELVGSINSYSGGLTELEFLPMDELADWLTNWGEGLDSSRLDDLLRQTRNGEFDDRDPYFRLDSWNAPVSSNGDYSDDIDDIAEYIDDNADELDRWDLNDDLADSIRAALDDPEDDDDDEDEDIELLPREDIAAVLADWYADTERALPTDDELRRNAARCEAQERPLDPADVRDWADFRLTL